MVEMSQWQRASRWLRHEHLRKVSKDMLWEILELRHFVTYVGLYRLKIVTKEKELSTIVLKHDTSSVNSTAGGTLSGMATKDGGGGAHRIFIEQHPHDQTTEAHHKKDILVIANSG